MLGPLGFWEILFILMLALLIFGPRRLPEIGRALGRAMGELRKATSDFTSALDTEVSLDDEPTSRDSTHRGSAASRKSMPTASPSAPASSTPSSSTELRSDSHPDIPVETATDPSSSETLEPSEPA